MPVWSNAPMSKEEGRWSEIWAETPFSMSSSVCFMVLGKGT